MMAAELAAPLPATLRHERPVVIAAGGTGGHFFPAEALAAELRRRGHRVVLMTDARSAARAAASFEAGDTVVLPGAGIAGRGLRRGALAVLALGRGTLAARARLRALRPSVIAGFGGYPCVAPVLASRALHPRAAVVLHEQNGVLGRANRVLARFADAVALGMADTARVPAGRRRVTTGNPVRDPVLQAAAAYVPPTADGPVRLLVTGGSLGARVFSDTVPEAVALLPAPLRARLRVVQQCRAEDMERVRAAYAALGVPAELSPFFPDLAARIAAAHYVVARAGASTVAELAAIGRPCLLVPLPGAIDGHQLRNAAAVDADVLEQPAFDPAALARLLADRLSDPELLAMKAHAVAAHGRPDAASVLADLVEQLAAERTTA